MGGAVAFEKSRQRVLRNLLEELIREMLLAEQPTVPPRRRNPSFAAGQQPAAKSETIGFNQLRQVLAKNPTQLTGQEIGQVIDYVASKDDLKQDFIAMQEKEIQNLETVLDKNLDHNKIRTFATKVEFGRAAKHFHDQQQKSQQTGGKPPPVPTSQAKKQTGAGMQKVSLPKQQLSKRFTDIVGQRFNQIKTAPGLNPQQKERIIAQLGSIQFAPEGSEESKLRQIEDLIKTTVGSSRAEIPVPTARRSISAPQIPQPQKSSGLFGKAKSLLGLNELSLVEAMREE